MSFNTVKIQIADGEDGSDLIAEYEKLERICDEYGDAPHGHTIVAQIFAHKDDRRKFFLSGRVLNKEESDAFAAVLARSTFAPHKFCECDVIHSSDEEAFNQCHACGCRVV